MDKEIEKYIQLLVNLCFENADLSRLYGSGRDEAAENIREFFYRLMVETLIDNLSPDQMDSMEGVDINSDAALEKLQQFAAQIPGFLFILDEKLRKEAESIKSSGKIPTSELEITRN